MSLNQPDLGVAFRKSLHDHWRAFLIEGIILVVLGLAAIALPPIAGLATTVVLGWLFLFGGFVGLTYMYELTAKSFFLPDIRVGGEAGGFIVGTAGNSAYFEGDVEVMLKFRLGVGAGLFYMVPVAFPPASSTDSSTSQLGGLSYRLKMMFVW